MKKIVLSQTMTAKGKTRFTGLYDFDGNAAVIETEYDADGITLVISVYPVKKNYRDCGISEEELENTCSMHNNCWDCPLNEYCGEECE